MYSAPGADEVAWRTCDWRRFASPRSFSADGTQLLTVAADTEYGGEADYSRATFAIFSATEGPSGQRTLVKAPDGTTAAYWRSEDRLLFQTTVFDDEGVATGTALQDCGLNGRCREVARGAGVVVGDQF